MACVCFLIACVAHPTLLLAPLHLLVIAATVTSVVVMLPNNCTGLTLDKRFSGDAPLARRMQSRGPHHEGVDDTEEGEVS